jgi:hypothetical protein
MARWSPPLIRLWHPLWQRGHARKNHFLCEMARTMLYEHRTTRSYWAKAVNTACHVGNRIFLRAFLNKTCYELMHGEHLEWGISGLLVVGSSFSRMVGLISLSRGLPMGFSWGMLVILEHFVFSTLIITSWRLRRPSTRHNHVVHLFESLLVLSCRWEAQRIFGWYRGWFSSLIPRWWHGSTLLSRMVDKDQWLLKKL